MRLLGMLEHGIYGSGVDECEGMDVDEIMERYGVDQQDTGEVVMGTEDSDGDGEDWVDIDDGDGPSNSDLNLPLVEVPSTMSPFPDEEQEQGYFSALKVRTQQRHVPPNFGVLEDEWDGGEYPVTEYLQVGKKQTGQVPINLTKDIWLPRARLWARALELMLTAQHVMSARAQAN